MNAVMSTVIDEQHHGPLLEDINHVAEYVGISPEMIMTPINGYCSEREVKWLTGIRRHMKSERSGLLYVGEQKNPTVAERMMAMAGALTRNYIDARVMSLPEVLSAAKSGDHGARVLLVPAFHHKGIEPLKAYQTNALFGMLLSRLRGQTATILQIDSLEGVEKAYGEPVASLLGAHYSQYK